MNLTRIRIFCALILLMLTVWPASGAVYEPAAIMPPNPPREFRGAWIATVANIDWPSKPGLPVAQQKAELIALLNRAVQLKLNAVIFQVRSECDAMYDSPFEPWSEYLTGTQGKAPQPFYDPLAFAIREAHERGLELHAWFNPFRARHFASKSPLAPNHIARTHPELVRHYGPQLWLDPGEPAVRAYVLKVVMNVVRRYDIDGVQFDDYFYPYPIKDSQGREVDFPDYASWEKYGIHSGLSRDDWRRRNVNEFIESVYHSIKAVKPWVKFGISPFGIWRPGFPKQIRGLDAYGKLYADSRLWLANGWVDYLSPQLYWPINAPQQSFPVLLNWWAEQNLQHRHLWPGLDAAAVGERFSADEIARQLKILRAKPGVTGEIFYHLRTLADNRALDNVVRTAYAQPALVPASPWLNSQPPDKPRLMVTAENNSRVSVRWEFSGGEPDWLWVLQFRADGHWATEILPADQTTHTFYQPAPEMISVRAVDRTENLSASAALKRVTGSLPESGDF